MKKASNQQREEKEIGSPSAHQDLLDVLLANLVGQVGDSPLDRFGDHLEGR